MVRLKHRYLLLDILYPDPSTWPASIKQKQNRKSNPPDTTGYDEPPAQLAIHTPTPDSLTPGLLAKMVREEVAEMFGDWAVGKLGGAAGGGINGAFFFFFLSHFFFFFSYSFRSFISS